MSRSDAEWEEQRQRAIKVRSKLYEVLDDLEEIDDIRFTEIDDIVRGVENNVEAAVSFTNQMIGRLTRDFDT